MSFWKAFTLLLLLAPCWSDPAGAPVQQSFMRLESLLPSAEIKATEAVTSVTAAEPIIWQGFYSAHDLTWQIVRGGAGVRNGDLIVTAQGSTPVIVAPKDPAIDWRLYQAIEIRMSAQAGTEIKIKIGEFESRQKLGPSGQYSVYHFDINVDAPKGGRILGVMPTDSTSGEVAIHSIKLLPKVAEFSKAAGAALNLGKGDDYRNALYVRSPAIITFPLTVPRNGFLHFSTGTTAKDTPMTFRVSVEGTAGSLYSKSISNNSRWEDASVDLTRWSGQHIRLQLRTETPQAGSVALWANPIVSTTLRPARLNVVIYTIDTLRADHSNLYGYARSTTPFLKSLGEAGIVFEDCQSQATWTKPSIASMMTSTYAFTHGIMNDSGTIPAGSATLAEQLHKADYATAAVVSTPFVGRATGLERGFDYFSEYPVVLRQHDARTDRDTDSAALNRVIFPWLERHREEPFFLYAHATDPHAPFGAPAPFDGKFANPAETAAFNRTYASFHSNHEYGGGAVVSPDMCKQRDINASRFITQAVDRYDEEILHNDHSFELLVAKLRQLGVLNNTLIIVMSDHGEEFWDHGWTAHGHSVYQELTHSVLLMWNPGLFPTPRRVKDPVQLIDVMPTVLEALKLKPPSVIEGQSVLPLAMGRAFKRTGLVLSSRFAAAQPMGLVPENGVDDFAIIDDHWKFIYRNKAAKAGVRKVELYDRLSDRTEKRDVSADHPDLVEERTAALSQWIQAQNKIRAVIGHPGQSQLDAQTLNQLRSLGYLGGNSQ